MAEYTRWNFFCLICITCAANVSTNTVEDCNLDEKAEVISSVTVYGYDYEDNEAIESTDTVVDHNPEKETNIFRDIAYDYNYVEYVRNISADIVGDFHYKVDGLATPRKPGRKEGTTTQGRSSKQKWGTPSEPTRINGGIEVSPPRKYPWQVSLMKNGIHICGGTLINSRWILTAAHCLICNDTDPSYNVLSPYTVRVGEHKRSTKAEDDYLKTKDYNLKYYKIHPDYPCETIQSSPAAFNNDLALLKLTSFIFMTNSIELPRENKTYAGEIATVTGWGQLYPGLDTSDASDVLMEAEVRIAHQEECKWPGFTAALPDTQLCVNPVSPSVSAFFGGSGDSSGSGDPCHGDSGGPLIVKKYNTNILVGVVSYGTECGGPTDPTVYANVSMALGWINDTMDDDICNPKCVASSFCDDGECKSSECGKNGKYGVTGQCECSPGWTGGSCSSPITGCGLANIGTFRRIGKKINRRTTKQNRGTDVSPPRKYPWQVSVMKRGVHICGGSIIHNNWILTAAQCFHDAKCVPDLATDVHKYIKVRVGEHRISASNDNDPTNTINYIANTYILHPLFSCSIEIRTPEYKRLNYDFALVKLTSDIPFNDVIRPVCLPDAVPSPPLFTGDQLIVSGWGNIKPGGPTSDNLKEAKAKKMDQASCNVIGLGSRMLPVTQFCAGTASTPIPGQGPCPGDTGGPLVKKVGSQHIQVGVVSFGGGCVLSSSSSSIYASVSSVLSWVRTHVPILY